MLLRPNILLLSNDEEERGVMERVIGDYATITFADSIRGIERLLREDVYDACLCSWIFQKHLWSEALANIRTIHPDLPVIVLSRTGGEKEWIEVLDAGAFDLLTAPYRPPAVMAMLDQAVSSHDAFVTGVHPTPIHAKAS